MPSLHPGIREELKTTYTKLLAAGDIRSRERMQGYYDTFRREFGPVALGALTGQDLLECMHAHGGTESLVYWLEFKNDDVFPGIFGSIAGGNASKFGLYRRADDNQWVTGSGKTTRLLSVREAVAIATHHRDQLIAAVRILETRQPRTDDAHYLQLQQDLTEAAPDVEDTAWGHKYLSLLFPDLIDDFHVNQFQRHHLVRSLEVPVLDGDKAHRGRYVNAGRFVDMSQQLNLSIHDLGMALNERNGSPAKYWRVGTTDDQNQRRKYWPMMRDGKVVAIGWPKLGDLSALLAADNSRDSLKEHLRNRYPGREQAVGRDASQLLWFLKMAEGDRVVVADGQTVLGIGEITGAYHHEASMEFPHQRPVVWRSLTEWTMDEGLRSSVANIKEPANRVEIERRIFEDRAAVVDVPRPPISPTDKPKSGHRGLLDRLEGVPGLIQAALDRKGQVIVYGPPGTGKTYWAMRAARDLAAMRLAGVAYDKLGEADRAHLARPQSSPVRMTSFHPEYGYEDFIEGYRPGVASDGTLLFKRADGVFRKLCDDASKTPGTDFYLIIDEINRGDVPRIFGELLTLLEYDKRGQEVVLPLSGEHFHVPKNVFVIGTMNTADRSIALLDVALRRRFAFVELMPDYSLLRGISVSGLPLAGWLEDINVRIRRTGGGDARNRQIGHAFLFAKGAPINTIDQLVAALREDIVPLLEEYCYDDFTQLSEILGNKLVDTPNERIRRELFDVGRSTDLVNALMRPEISTTGGAVDAAFDPTDEEEEDEAP